MRTAAAGAIVLVLAVSGAAAAQTPARLQGTFAMRGTLTAVDHIYGEHRGQLVKRTWKFSPQCASGSCRRVLLKRQRSGRHILDVLMLKRRGPGLYVGRGQFWVALRCAGQVIAHGGLAQETITVRITHAGTVGTKRLATGISATYNNPSRVNLTRCPGGIGHDAASYRGHLTSPLP